MPTRKSPRKGSLQYWPRKRADKFLPSVNWQAIDSDKKIKGFICYKAGMATAFVKDNTPDSMSQGKEIAVPVTILECPPLKILSVRFYKDNDVVKDMLVEGVDKDKNLKRKIKIPSDSKKLLKSKDFDSDNNSSLKNIDYDNLTVIAYADVSKTNLKKKPDLIEVGLSGSLEDKKNFIKENIGKEISITEFFNENDLIDLRGLTKGKGTQGPVKRFGVTLKSHKSEKGRRRPGSIGPWHPARVTFRVPMAGQLGMFTRISYNSNIIGLGKVQELEGEKKNMLKDIKKYGDVKTNYIIVKGSVQGPSKRQLIACAPLRPTKKTDKIAYDLVAIK
ncbi:50S ribosomal protein L3 [Candidatus Pacearchaeota archaeon]|nr:50S ribosomal protein L3 [Candidatus Pacearchaeota archaeon]